MNRLEYEVIVAKHKHSDLAEMSAWCQDLWGPIWSPFDNKDGLWNCLWAGPRVHPVSYRWCFDTQEHANWFALRWL